MKRLASAAALAATSPLAASTIDLGWMDEIPSEYRGRWDSNAAACAGAPGRQRVELGADRLKVGGDPFRAESIGWDSQGGVMVHSRYAGPGKAWARYDHFYLSEDRRTMVRFREYRSYPLVRCVGR